MKGVPIWLSFLIACGMLLSSASARSGEILSPDLADGVKGHDGITYLDLARAIVPDLAAAKGGYFGGAPAALRQIDGFGWSDGASGQAGPVSLMALPYRTGGRDRLAALIKLGPGGGTALALYDLSSAPKLLDALDIALDRFTGFAGPGRLAIGSGTDVLLVDGRHFNSSQGYAATTLLTVEGDRIVPVDTIYTLDERGCNYRRTQQLSFSAAPDAGGHAPILAEVVDAVEATDEQCNEPPPEPSSSIIGVTYRWDGARYKPDSDAFTRLAEENEKRF